MINGWPRPTHIRCHLLISLLPIAGILEHLPAARGGAIIINWLLWGVGVGTLAGAGEGVVVGAVHVLVGGDGRGKAVGALWSTSGVNIASTRTPISLTILGRSLLPTHLLPDHLMVLLLEPHQLLLLLLWHLIHKGLIRTAYWGFIEVRCVAGTAWGRYLTIV